ncbi:MAG: hypothetical protein NPIRA02_24840 [Nitrospirales bacterium]|nr:MAG: hypothetical protein NPIRA02_24840 [Nitrospirales bacterium]
MGDPQYQCFSTPLIRNRSNLTIRQHDIRWILAVNFLSFMILFSYTYARADDSTMAVTESTLRVPYTGAPSGSLSFPLYKGQNFSYFSAGVGLEERTLTYPSYSLKLILVQDGGAYLSNVAMTVHQLDGPVSFDIPAAHVEGPWVFINIPTGTYVLKAMNSQQQLLEKQIDVVDDKQKVLYLRW